MIAIARQPAQFDIPFGRALSKEASDEIERCVFAGTKDIGPCHYYDPCRDDTVWFHFPRTYVYDFSCLQTAIDRRVKRNLVYFEQD